MTDIKVSSTSRKASVNNRFIVEPYRAEALKQTVTSGFATISQKAAVKGLKLLMEAHLSDSRVVLAGSTIFVKEALLHTQPWAKEILEAEGVGKFIIVSIENVEFIE
jgi:hypothetical protein